MKLVIIAGGKGTRLNLKRIPKPMVKVGGKPVLQHQIELAKKYGISEVLILSGHLGHVISDYFFGQKKAGINIKNIIESYALGTAGCLRQLKDHITKTERFLVFSGDVVLKMDLNQLITYDSQTSPLATIVVQQSDHVHDSDLVLIDRKNKIIPFNISKRKGCETYKLMAVASLGIFSGQILDFIPEDRPSDLWKEILPNMIKENKNIIAYESAEYINDMGTPKRLRKVRRTWIKKP